MPTKSLRRSAIGPILFLDRLQQHEVALAVIDIGPARAGLPRRVGRLAGDIGAAATKPLAGGIDVVGGEDQRRRLPPLDALDLLEMQERAGARNPHEDPAALAIGIVALDLETHDVAIEGEGPGDVDHRDRLEVDMREHCEAPPAVRRWLPITPLSASLPFRSPSAPTA